MVTPSEKIWMDGTFVKWNEASVHVLTHSLHYGLGAFEGIRCYRGKGGSMIFRLREHVDRLFESAAERGVDLRYEHKLLRLRCDGGRPGERAGIPWRRVALVAAAA